MSYNSIQLNTACFIYDLTQSSSILALLSFGLGNSVAGDWFSYALSDDQQRLGFYSQYVSSTSSLPPQSWQPKRLSPQLAKCPLVGKFTWLRTTDQALYIRIYNIPLYFTLQKELLASRSLHFNSKKNTKVLKCYCILLKRASKLQIRWVLFMTDLPSLPNLHLSNCTNSSKHWSFSQLLCYLELNVFHTISSGVTSPGFLALPNSVLWHQPSYLTSSCPCFLNTVGISSS